MGWLRRATPTQLEHSLPKLVHTDRQTAGRGRHGRQWVGQHDGLAFSVITVASPKLLSIAVGVAIAETIEMLAGPTCVRLKWPNDVWISGGKVAGVLIERYADTRTNSQNVFVVGIGCNVNSYPNHHTFDEVAVPATSIAQATGRIVDRTEMLHTTASRLIEVIHEAVEDPADLLQRFESRCVLRGSMVRCQVGGQPIQGICEGIDAEGNLLIRNDHGLHSCHSGEAQRVRMAN